MVNTNETNLINNIKKYIEEKIFNKGKITNDNKTFNFLLELLKNHTNRNFKMDVIDYFNSINNIIYVKLKTDYRLLPLNIDDILYQKYEIKIKTKSKSREERQEIRKFISKNLLNYGKIDESNKYFNYLLDVLLEHPNRKAEKMDVKYFYGDGNVMSFYSIKNKKLINFSYKKCLGLFTETDNSKLTDAMRETIRDEIQDFFYENGFKTCNICQSVNSRYEIDHVKPFYIIKDNFFKSIEGIIKKPVNFCRKSITYAKNINFTTFAFNDEDKEFKELWKEYHYKQSTLQFLCVNCHDNKTKKDNKNKYIIN